MKEMIAAGREVKSSTQAQDVIDYCEAWYKAVNAAGYIPGLFVGAGVLLTGQQLYHLPFQHYWRSQSRVPDIPNRGYQVIQLSPSLQVNGVWIDLDVALDDNELRNGTVAPSEHCDSGRTGKSEVIH